MSVFYSTASSGSKSATLTASRLLGIVGMLVSTRPVVGTLVGTVLAGWPEATVAISDVDF